MYALQGPVRLARAAERFPVLSAVEPATFMTRRCNVGILELFEKLYNKLMDAYGQFNEEYAKASKQLRNSSDSTLVRVGKSDPSNARRQAAIQILKSRGYRPKQEDFM